MEVFNMRKVLSLMLCVAMLLSCVAFASAEETVKTGLSVIVNLTSSKNATAEANGVAHSNIQLIAVTVDANGVIDDCVIDYIQAKINFNAAGEIVTEKGTVFASKIELDDAYGMRKASPIGAEWDEQANAFAAYCVGKTAEQLQGIALNEQGQAVDVIASCTLTADEFLPGVLDAIAKAEHRGAKAGDVLKLAQYSTASNSKDATETADGQTQVYTHVGMFTLNGDVITSAYIDAVQATVKFNAQGKITTDLTAAVLTKNELKEGYGMKNISPIGKEWYEQAAGFCAFITGKTLNEAIAIAVNPGETDVVSSCTIGTDGFLQLIVKAGL